MHDVPTFTSYAQLSKFCKSNTWLQNSLVSVLQYSSQSFNYFNAHDLVNWLNQLTVDIQNAKKKDANNASNIDMILKNTIFDGHNVLYHWQKAAINKIHTFSPAELSSSIHMVVHFDMGIQSKFLATWYESAKSKIHQFTQQELLNNTIALKRLNLPNLSANFLRQAPEILYTCKVVYTEPHMMINHNFIKALESKADQEISTQHYTGRQ